MSLAGLPVQVFLECGAHVLEEALHLARQIGARRIAKQCSAVVQTNSRGTCCVRACMAALRQAAKEQEV